MHGQQNIKMKKSVSLFKKGMQ